MIGVERVTRPSTRHFRGRYLTPRRPVVLLGTNDHWRARTWTLASLAERIGDPAVPLAVLDRGRVRVDLERGIVHETRSFRGFLDELERTVPPVHYLRLRLDGPYRSLRDDLEIPAYCVARLFLDVSLLIGGVGTVVETHYDMLHSLVAQLRGRRRVTLFAPADRRHLYPYPMRTLHWHHSRVRLHAPDLARFPRFRDACPLRVDLAPGDVLFIPRGWWHHFETLEPSIAVNFFWLTPRLVPALAAARALWMLKQVHHY
jgi:lysine-specific demethylase 8